MRNVFLLFCFLNNGIMKIGKQGQRHAPQNAIIGPNDVNWPKTQYDSRVSNSNDKAYKWAEDNS